MILYFSGSSIILIERGNIDLIIFVIIFFAATNIGLFSILLVSFATLLKIYPIFTFPAFFNLKTKKTILIFIFLVILYIYPQLDNIFTAQQNLMYGTHAFGSKTIAIATLRHNSYLSNTVIIVALFLCSLFMTSFRKIRSEVKTIKSTLEEETLFLCGSLIYIGCFIVTSNYDHRLIFLLLCIPLVIKLNFKPLKYIIIISLIIGMNSFLILPLLGKIGFRINLLSKSFLFIIFLSITLIILKRKIFETFKLRYNHNNFI